MDGSIAYIRGYQEAADALIEHVEATDRHQDAFLFPIIYLFRHYRELLLKAIITKMVWVLDLKAPSAAELTKTHDLGRLWAWAKPLIEPLGDPASIRDELKDGNSVFADFQKFDSKAQTFRFSKSKSGKPHLPDFRVINIRIFRDECDRIASFLEGAFCSADQAWDYVAERRAESRWE